MAKFKITGEQPFRIAGTAFAISESTSGYTVKSSINYNWKTKPGIPQGDGATWADFSEAIPANKQAFIETRVPGVTFKLSGNSGEVLIQTY